MDDSTPYGPYTSLKLGKDKGWFPGRGADDEATGEVQNSGHYIIIYRNLDVDNKRPTLVEWGVTKVVQQGSKTGELSLL